MAFADRLPVVSAPGETHGRRASRCAVRTRKAVLAGVVEGKSSWKIAVILGISRNTVDFHIKNAMQKLEVTTRNAGAYQP
ncbi:helix-turn-helix transcriptional regulator [Bradyrhizobium sp. NDS-1]|uniref:helix-turn-helix domain-containing protein n=1 Tax=Bradyrhizobium sp. NDS-1 TaxID=3080014 RepID=UPI00293F428D|nr:helix-turn-helix transcriptional regulator [Bradyrhizobium sp. NDS-1]WOH75722.1 helix-turn-helix transcriptional regulator [Bradyrhizobium sp. NDS-1]